MKLLIVRHGDPDYSVDSLTEKGWREAEYLSERLVRLEVKSFYVSPLGRARDTGSLTLRKLGREAEECPWLREFDAPIRRPDVPDRKMIPWDWLPQDWTAEPRFYLPDQWYLPQAMAEADVKSAYDWVASGLDGLLERHGYRREGNCYRPLAANNDTIVLFCHFGVECVMLSHLLNISPMVLWHGTCAAPSSVTTLVTEERREGVALFRMSAFGDVSHLYHHGEAPAFAARFRECYANKDERRD
ncbi:MAG: histidine phosphatase family protein [Oscillospiraceae bacterium]|nr:histidine phosphatase family protein [Oscillospiraceae bacterium]